MKREVSPLKRHIEESPKLRSLRDKRRKRRMRVCILLGALALLLAGGFVYASHLPRIQLETVTVSGNKVVDTEDVVDHVQALLSGKYLYLIPHRNAFLYPKEKILGDLAHSFPRFKSVGVYRTDTNTLAVTVTEVRGRALWCGEKMADDAPCYFTDETGKIVSEAPMYSGNVYPRFFGGMIPAGFDSVLGQMFTDQTTFEDLLSFEIRVEELGFQVKGIVIGEREEDSLVIDLGAGRTAPVRFLKTADLRVLAGNLAAALKNPEVAKSMKESKASLEYFDLRFTNKVYYKFSSGK